MSDRSVSITIGTTGSIRHVNGVRLAGEESKDKMYEPKQSKKMVRVLTVIAYMFTVSFAAIMLSVYYVFLWQPRDADRRSYMDASLHSSKGVASTNCPPHTGREPTIAATVSTFPTTSREEVVTERPEPKFTSQPVQTTMATLVTRSLARTLYQSRPAYSQEDEDI